MISATGARNTVDAVTERMGMTTAHWQQITPTGVLIDSLHATQDEVCIRCVLGTCEHRLRSLDPLPHVVRLNAGRLFVVDGHHRLTVLRVRGSRWAKVRILEAA